MNGSGLPLDSAPITPTAPRCQANSHAQVFRRTSHLVKEQNMSQTQTPTNPPKKAYHAPKLNPLGKIEQLTQGGSGIGIEPLGFNISGVP